MFLRKKNIKSDFGFVFYFNFPQSASHDRKNCVHVMTWFFLCVFLLFFVYSSSVRIEIHESWHFPPFPLGHVHILCFAVFALNEQKCRVRLCFDAGNASTKLYYALKPKKQSLLSSSLYTPFCMRFNMRNFFFFSRFYYTYLMWETDNVENVVKWYELDVRHPSIHIRYCVMMTLMLQIYMPIIL